MLAITGGINEPGVVTGEIASGVTIYGFGYGLSNGSINEPGLSPSEAR